MLHLITVDEVIKVARPIGGAIDKEKILSFIIESELMYVKPVLGSKLYLDLIEKGESNENYITLLNGGSYTTNAGDVNVFAGLKATIAYYVYAKNVMVGDFQSTRYGMVLKESDYSTHISNKERSDCYNEALEVANCYLRDCIVFCNEKGLEVSTKPQRTAGGIRIKRIG